MTFSTYCKKFLPQFPETHDWSFIQLQFREIKIGFQKAQLLFSKFKKQFLNFHLQSVEYFDTCIWKF